MKPGRKAGGDVLKELEPATPMLEKAMKLAYGRTADNEAAELVRLWRSMELEALRLAERRKQIGEKRIEAAEGGQSADAEALEYWQTKRALDGMSGREHRRLMIVASYALKVHNAAWFRQVADAIDEEFTGDRQDKYPRQAAALVLLGGSQPTIGEACAALERAGHRPANCGDDDWARIVRRACGPLIKKGKRGRPRKK